MLKCLVADDSALYRKLVRSALEQIDGVEVLDTARDGAEAVRKCVELKPDLVTMDIEMPNMDGIQAVRELQRHGSDARIIMVSSLTATGASITTAALRAGAFDFVLKPTTGSLEESLEALTSQLRQRVASLAAVGMSQTSTTRPKLDNRDSVKSSVPNRSAGTSNWRNLVGQRDNFEAAESTGNTKPPPGCPAGAIRSDESATRQQGPPFAAAIDASSKLNLGSSPGRIAGPSSATGAILPSRVAALCIGVSTGGPQALGQVIPSLPRDLSFPVFVVQHMPPVFTKSLAEQLNNHSRLEVVEAQHQQTAQPGFVYLAPGGKQMGVMATLGRTIIQITDAPPQSNAKPSVDFLFRSASQTFGNQLVAAVLTGMGDDGTEGCRVIKSQGGFVATQSEHSCVVYGMPRRVYEAGLSDQVLDLCGIEALIQRCSQKAVLQCQ